MRFAQDKAILILFDTKSVSVYECLKTVTGTAIADFSLTSSWQQIKFMFTTNHDETVIYLL